MSKKNTITYYHTKSKASSLLTGHFSLKFGDEEGKVHGKTLGKMWGDIKDNLGTRNETHSAQEVNYDEWRYDASNGLVTIILTLEYKDSQRYEQAKRYAIEPTNYDFLDANCVKFVADINRIAGGLDQPSLGTFITREIYNEMGETPAAKQMEFIYGIHGVTIRLEPNKQREIEKEYNLPEGSVIPLSYEYIASEYSDQIQYKYKINNPKIGLTKEDIYKAQMDSIDSVMEITKKKASDPNSMEDVMSKVKQAQKLAEQAAFGNWDGIPFIKGAKVSPDKKDDKKTGFEGIIQQEISQESVGKFKSPADIAKFAAGVVNKRGKEVTDDVMEKVKKAQTMAEDQNWLEKQMGLIAKVTDMYQKYQEEQALPCCEAGEIKTDSCKLCYEVEL